MKTIPFLSALTFCTQMTIAAIAQDICKQNYAPAIDDSIVLQKVIQQGIISPDEARHRMAEKKVTDLRQKREITVLVVHQRLTRNPNVNLFGGQLILRNCAAGSMQCEVNFRQVNAKALEFVWSNDTKSAVNSWRDLRATAISQNWYAQADVILGLTEDNFNDFVGYASIDNDCQAPIDRGHLVLYAQVTNSFLAHELGHILGMQHDNTPNSLMNATVSLTPIQWLPLIGIAIIKTWNLRFVSPLLETWDRTSPSSVLPTPCKNNSIFNCPSSFHLLLYGFTMHWGCRFFIPPRFKLQPRLISQGCQLESIFCMFKHQGSDGQNRL
ncbi:MAG: hypothetical protein IPO07_14315 [Haliscomenobacter sp.]|nr:matrixin family metalloprotease [Haliscomenobacter sp.]MBK9489807.1 hypothetical protein [Haliscomenobacter sp.]